MIITLYDALTYAISHRFFTSSLSESEIYETLLKIAKLKEESEQFDKVCWMMSNEKGWLNCSDFTTRFIDELNKNNISNFLVKM